MPKLAQRLDALKPSATLALNAQAKALAESGVHVVNLSVGEPDFAPPPQVTEAAKTGIDQGHIRYGTPGGSKSLKQAIQAKLKKDQGLEYDLDQIVCGIGAKEILFHTSYAVLDKGDEAIVPTPYWVSYKTHIELCGAKLKELPIHTNPQNEAELDLDLLQRMINPKTKLIILNSPNNPAGYVLPREHIRKLAAILEPHDLWIVSDEIYEHLCFEGQHYSIAQVSNALYNKTLIVNGLSKAYSMTGFRVGYAAGAAQLTSKLKNLQSQSSTCLPGFIEDAAIAALHAGPEAMQTAYHSLNERRLLVIEMLEHAAQDFEISFIKPQGAFYVFVDLRQILKKHQMTSLTFSEKLLNEYHVAMVAGEAFGAPGYVRLSYAVKTESLRRGIEKFLELVNDLSSRLR